MPAVGYGIYNTLGSPNKGETQ